MQIMHARQKTHRGSEPGEAEPYWYSRGLELAVAVADAGLESESGA